MANVLVVANRTASSDEVLEAIRARHGQGDATFVLLVPATPHGVAWAADMHSGSHDAEASLVRALERMKDEGIEADGMVGDPDPLAAVEDAVNSGSYDEVIVSTLPGHLSKWLKLDLPSRVARVTGLPVTHVVGSEAG